MSCTDLGIGNNPYVKRVEIMCTAPDNSGDYDRILSALNTQNERISEQSEILNTLIQINTEQLEDAVLYLSDKINLIKETTHENQ